ncbi:MAG: hypothetical protein AAF288_02245 [Planctomycetota bacterium]
MTRAAAILDDRARLAAYDAVARRLADQAAGASATEIAGGATTASTNNPSEAISSDPIEAPPAAPGLTERGQWNASVTAGAGGADDVLVLSLDAVDPVTAWPSTTKTPVLTLRAREGRIEAFVTTGFRCEDRNGRVRVSVQLDDGPAERVTLRESGDRLSLFWYDGAEAFKQLRGAERLTFTFPPIHSGTRTAVFELDGLEALGPLLDDAVAE